MASSVRVLVLAASLALAAVPALVQPAYAAQTGSMEALRKKQQELNDAIYWLDAMAGASNVFLLHDEKGFGPPGLPPIPFLPLSEQTLNQMLTLQVLTGQMKLEDMPGYVAYLRRTTEDNRARIRVRLSELRRLRDQNDSQIAQAMRLQQPWAFGLPPAPPVAPVYQGPDSRCDDATGTWSHSTQGIGSSSWSITSAGGRLEAVESGLGRARGTATFDGSSLQIDFKTGGVSGYYRWDLDAACTGGEGELVFKSGMSGTYKSTLTR